MRRAKAKANPHKKDFYDLHSLANKQWGAAYNASKRDLEERGAWQARRAKLWDACAANYERAGKVAPDALNAESCAAAAKAARASAALDWENAAHNGHPKKTARANPQKRRPPASRKPPRKPNPVTVDRLTFRELGAAGTRYPAWIDRARGKSGVYVIRERGVPAGPVLYVGESHSDKLYETMTRHFQVWRGDTAGPSYPRESVWIAFKVVAASKAVPAQDSLICRYSPRDNGTNPCADVPF